jgi:regulator of protease activity HflC (stomatin/prohibitin superfamily)
MGLQTVEIKTMGAADDHGSPLEVSGQFVYRIIDSVAANFKTRNLDKFLYEQGESALRAVVANYPYDVDSSGHPGTQCCLSKQSDIIDKKLVKFFQSLVDHVGVKVETFRLISVRYPERMDKLLLARQEAQSQVTARRTIAEGTAGILEETLHRLKVLGIELSEKERNRFATNLTMLLVNHGHTTINIFDGAEAKS